MGTFQAGVMDGLRPRFPAAIHTNTNAWRQRQVERNVRKTTACGDNRNIGFWRACRSKRPFLNFLSTHYSFRKMCSGVVTVLRGAGSG